ncbi:MAG: hypothetical protein ACK4UO_13045 [Pseudolabrys sp.]
MSSSLFGRSQVDEANEFLKVHKPVGSINFNRDTIVVFYEDDAAADIVDLLQSVRDARFNQQIALHMLKDELAGLNPDKDKHGHRQRELTEAIAATSEAVAIQDTKEAYLLERIDERRANPPARF